MNDIRKTLADRGSKYGTFESNATVAQRLKDIWRLSPGAIGLSIHADLIRTQPDTTSMVVHEGMEMILHKIARICNGDPMYLDSWVDIVGYAQLVVDHLKKQEGTRIEFYPDPRNREEELSGNQEEKGPEPAPFDGTRDFVQTGQAIHERGCNSLGLGTRKQALRRYADIGAKAHRAAESEYGNSSERADISNDNSFMPRFVDNQASCGCSSTEPVRQESGRCETDHRVRWPRS